MGDLRAPLICAVTLLAGSARVAGQETYRRADIDQDGQLHIVLAGGREITPLKDKDQVGFEKAAVSPDGRAVGWLALYPNCCTSYPIPLKMVIYMNGRHRELTGDGLPVWRWMFRDGGKRVAFEQETVHGGLGVHYELHDVATGRLVSAFSPDPENPGQPPAWVRALDDMSH
ncbi:MAG: hypothetical protein M3P13_14105 [Acidobacteriota bacterium]|nr:hypothetical protein [Acidobacteriota bacterium]